MADRPSDVAESSRVQRRRALAFGARAEQAAAVALERDGWVVLDRNWRGRGGELDLVVRRGDQLRFVEIKARRGDLDDGVQQIGPWKRSRLSRAARAWMVMHDVDVREMAFLVGLAREVGDTWSFEWIDDAFDEA